MSMLPGVHFCYGWPKNFPTSAPSEDLKVVELLRDIDILMMRNKGCGHEPPHADCAIQPYGPSNHNSNIEFMSVTARFRPPIRLGQRLEQLCRTLPASFSKGLKHLSRSCPRSSASQPGEGHPKIVPAATIPPHEQVILHIATFPVLDILL